MTISAQSKSQEDVVLGRFPFGEPVHKLRQQDRGKKRVFVLGVYASAVHAKWLDQDGNQLVRALAVASEPHIFWKGENATDIIGAIKVPAGAGTLVPASENLNGPSGRVLDYRFLAPLGLGRHQAWLCDLVPWSLQNAGQLLAIEQVYKPRMGQFNLPEVTVPPAQHLACIIDDERRAAITQEFLDSEAEVLVLLGDEPLKHYVAPLTGMPASLVRYGTDCKSYGRRHPARIEGKEIDILPLVHPRQAGRLGRSSERWRVLHSEWMKQVANRLL